MYIRPGASGGSVGHPVLVGNRAAHDVVARGGGLVTFLGVGAGEAGVAMSNTVAVRSAVAHRVRSPPLVGVIAATLPPTATPGLGRKLVMEGNDLAGEGEVGGDTRGVGVDKML